MSEIFENNELPDDWRVSRLADICHPRKAMVDPKFMNEMPYVGLEHLDSGSFSIARWGNSQEVKSSKTHFQQGDVLYGKLRPYLDKAILAPWPGICSTELIALQVKPDKADSQYLACLVHTGPFIKHAIDTTAGTNLPRTS
jgi:type I restriction enzyme S subunit